MLQLCTLDQLPNHESRGFTLKGQAFFVIRQDQRLYAYRNSCPHLGIPLEWQEHVFLDPDGELIQCSSHGALFAIDDGECLSGPCSGEFLTPVSIELQDDRVMVDLDPA